MTMTHEDVKRRVGPLRRNPDEKRFKEFQAWVEANLDAICRHQNSRWIISILDTYVDLAGPGLRECAMAISMPVHWEKLVQTSLQSRPVGEHKVPEGRIQLWDGISSFNTKKGADMFQNWCRRMCNLTRPYPAMRKMFLTLMKRMFQEPSSTLSLLNRHCKSDVKGTFEREMECQKL